MMATRQTHLQRLLRAEQNLANIAKRCGVTRTTPYRWRNGTRMPSRQAAERLVAIYADRGLTLEGCWKLRHEA